MWTWDFFGQQLVNGLTLGSVYALIALGYSMVYGILKLLNFAHGEVYMIGAFVGYGVLNVLGGPLAPAVPVALLLVLMFAAAMLGSGLLGVAIERFAYRPLRNAPRIAPLISALGVSFFLQSSALLLFSADIRSYDTFSLAGGKLSLFVSRTRIGKAMRATAFDREAAAMMGIDVDRVIVVTFFIGSALAGAAGVFNCLVYQQVWPYMGFQAGLFAFIAAVVGGIGNLPGAVLGGLIIGLAESFSIGYVSSTFEAAIVFAILIVVLIVRPSGLLGRAAVQKV